MDPWTLFIGFLLGVCISSLVWDSILRREKVRNEEHENSLIDEIIYHVDTIEAMQKGEGQ